MFWLEGNSKLNYHRYLFFDSARKALQLSTALQNPAFLPVQAVP